MVSHVENMEKSFNRLCHKVDIIGKNQVKFGSRLDKMEEILFGERKELMTSTYTTESVDFEPGENNGDNNVSNVKNNWKYVKDVMKQTTLDKLLFNWHDLEVEETWQQWVNKYPKNKLNKEDCSERNRDVENMSRWRKFVAINNEFSNNEFGTIPNKKEDNARLPIIIIFVFFCPIATGKVSILFIVSSSMSFTSAKLVLANKDKKHGK